MKKTKITCFLLLLLRFKLLKHIKILLSTACAFLIIVYCCSCGKGNPKIAFYIYDGDDTFISELMSCIMAEIPSDIDYEICDAGDSQATQNQQIIERIGGNYSLFVINAVDRLACSSIVEKCSSENIPVIFFNREPLEDALASGDAYYVGAAADSLGSKQADMVANAFTNNFIDSKYDRNGDGIVQLVILKGEQGHQDAEKRTDHCVSRLKALGFQVETLTIEVADWNRRDAYNAMAQIYDQFESQIELVFSNNDDMALGAIDYLIETGVFADNNNSGFDQPFVIVGVDGTAVGLEAIRKGLLYGTVNNDSSKQTEAILALADYIMNNKDFANFPYPINNERYIYIDGDIITRTNLSDYTEN